MRLHPRGHALLERIVGLAQALIRHFDLDRLNRDGAGLAVIVLASLDKLRHVFHAMNDVSHFAGGIQHWRIDRVPVMFFELDAGVVFDPEVVLLNRHRVATFALQNSLEGGAYIGDAFGVWIIRVFRKPGKDIATDNLFTRFFGRD